MGLIKAIAGAAGGVLADSWREFIYCDSIDKDTLVVKGLKRSSGRSSNKKGEDNIISNGSIVAVNEGQCMLIVEQGKVVDVCAEAGEFVFDKSTEPSIFYGGLGKGILDTFKTIGKRFTFGGDTGKDQRVYFVNIKQILDNKFGTMNPVPFSIYNKNAGLDFQVDLRCNGIYTYKIVDPILFYKEISGNVTDEYGKVQIADTLRSEFLNALQPALASISAAGISYSQIPAHTKELKEALSVELTSSWREIYGIEIVTVGINSVTLTEEDRERIKKYDDLRALSDPTMAAASLVTGQTAALQNLHKGQGGQMAGLVGMGMINNSTGMNANSLFAMGQQTQQTQQAQQAAPAEDSWTCACGTVNTGKFCKECGEKKPVPVAANSWTCACGTVNTGKFCKDCGVKKPEDGWTCKCGAVNKGKFCMECGTKKPAGAPLYKCDKCGWEPEDPMNPPKFCMECGDPFNDEDIK